MTNVFVSHASADRSTIEEIVNLLEENGFETWYSVDDIQATTDWERSIRAALEKCDWFLVALSRESVASQWVGAEVHWAIQNRPSRIVPVLLEPCDPAQLHLMLPKIQHVELGPDRAAFRHALLAVWNLTEGPVAHDRFTHVETLGKGGMGEVSLAYDEYLKRHVAIKRISSTLRNTGDLKKRFLQEARSAAGLNHPNIVSILSIDSDDQGPFLVLEYVDGGTLEDRLKQDALSLRESLAYARDMLSALNHAHEKGIVHRDIKPRNILLSKGGVPKLADFGLAWLTSPDDAEAGNATRSTTEGTPPYLAPELVNRSDSPNPRTDLYSLGVTFYQMVTGKRPHPLTESKVPSVALAFMRKLVHENASLRFASAADALEECVEVERALDLAERTEEKTRERINSTVAMAFQQCGENRLLDAETAFSRVLAEEPEHFAALTGMLLVHLAKGDMTAADRVYRLLQSLKGNDPAYSRLRRFLEDLNRTPKLSITPTRLPYSYKLADLRESRLVKELVEASSETINLGDVGELLIELATKQRPDDPFNYTASSEGEHVFEFRLNEVTVNARYRFAKRSGRFFRKSQPSKGIVGLTIEGEPFECYRLIRYLMHTLQRRFKRPINDFLSSNAEELFHEDTSTRIAEWKAYDFDFAGLAKFRYSSGGWTVPT